jgi:ATP-binding cassette subfamily C protein
MAPHAAMREAQSRAAAVLPLLAALGVLLALATLALPLFFMQVLDRVLTTGSESTLAWLLAGLAVALVIQAVFEWLRARAMALAGARLADALALPAFDAVATAGPQPLHDLAQLRAFAASPAAAAMLELAWIPPLLLVLALLHPVYALVAAGCAVLLLLLGLAAEGGTRRTLMAANDAAAHSIAEMAVALRGAEAVVAMGMLPALQARWQGGQVAMLARANAAGRRAKAIATAIRAARLLMTGAMVATGVLLVLADAATPGSMIAANLLLARLLLPFEQLGATLRQSTDALAAWRRLRIALDQPEAPREKIAMPCRVGRLEVQRLVFLPPGAPRPVLRGLSFAVEPGQVLAIIGASGAGKSTLLRLLLGMAAPTAGSVQLDGYATHLWDREDFARHVGYLPQNFPLTDASIGETIARLGKPDPAMLIDAARQAGLHGLIGRLPQGYATKLAEAGFLLSEGQRQRLALARALYGAPKLLVLDEPNAHLDAEGEAALIAAIGAVRRRGGAVVLVAHRRALVQAADTLLVLRDGLIDRYGERGLVLDEMAGGPVRLARAAAT